MSARKTCAGSGREPTPGSLTFDGHTPSGRKRCFANCTGCGLAYQLTAAGRLRVHRATQ